MAYNDYNPYQDVLGIYNAKVGYNTAKTDEERKRQNEIANAARKNLEAYGYKDVAEQLSATGADATAARKILEKYAPPKTTAPDSTTLSNTELITVNNNETRNKINQLWGTQTKDREIMAGKYDKLESTAYENPFETEEGKAIIGKYDLKALQGRNNALASGSSSNGGNIDSYAAANALRQQATLTAKGQTMALDAHNNKINNVKGILESLGVYQQNQDKGMQNTIGLQSNEGQRLFENEETAKNNEVARLSEEANVTGYVPNEWTIKNDAVYNEFLNPDGTFKTEKEGVDIQALINQTNDPATKQKLAVVRAKKALGNLNKYGQYLNQGDIAFMENQKTEAADQFDKNDATVRESLKTDAETSKYNTDANVKMNTDNNATAMAQTNAQIQAEKDLLYLQSMGVTEEEIKAMDTAVDNINNMFKDDETHKKKGDMIIKNGGGSYSPASGVSVSSYLHPVVNYLYSNPNITMEQMEYILESIGFKDAYDKAKASGDLDYIFK